MNILSKLRKYAKIRTLIGLFLIGVLFLVIGTFALKAPKGEKLTAEATIDRIVEERFGDETNYTVYLSFTDANGVRHEDLEYGAYSSGMEEGGTVTIEYEAENPEAISTPDGEFIPYIILAVGAIALIASVILGIKAVKTSADDFNELDRVKADPQQAEAIKNSNEPMSEYYFHFTGKMNQSYIMETPQRTPVFEAICDKIGVVSDYEYTFKNHQTGVSRPCKVSHTLTQSNGIGMGFSIATASAFKIEGKRNWDYLGELGYSIEPGIRGIKLNFDLYHYGVKVGNLEAAGVNILSDDKQYRLGDAIPGKGLYKVTCRPSDIEGAFFACFSAARTELF